MAVSADEKERQAIAVELSLARDELNGVSRRIDRLQERLSRLESGRSIQTPYQPPTQDRPPQVGPTQPAPAPESERPAASEAPAHRRTPVPPAGVASVGSTPFTYPFDWENLLGRNWFAIIGAISLALGIGFFLKLSFDNNWIGDTGRIILGIALGMALLGVGEFAQRRAPFWAQAVSAGAAAILYTSIYAAFALYQLIRPDAALLFLAVVVAMAGLLAVRYESIVIGFLGIIGAFVAPVLLGPDLPDIRLVLPYILVVDLGILGVSALRNWRWFILMGWIGSYGLFAYGSGQFPDYEPLLMQAGLTGIFLIFAGATTLFHILWKRIPDPMDMSLVAVNATAFFALTVDILWEDYQVWFGLISLSLSLSYALIALASIRRPGAPPQIALITLPMALVFLTIAVPLQLSGVWLTTAWAAQGAALVWAGFLLYRAPMRAFGLGALGLAAGNLLLSGAPADFIDNFRPVLNERFPVFVFVIAAFYAAAYLYRRNRSLAEEREELVIPALVTIANLLTLALLSTEAIHYFNSRTYEFGTNHASNGILLSLTVLWSIYATILVAVGHIGRMPLARWSGLVLAIVAAIKLLALDTFAVRLDPLTFTPVLNPHFLTFIVALVPLITAAYSFRKEELRVTEAEVSVFEVMLTAANLVALWGMSQEVVHYFDSREITSGAAQTGAKHLSLTVLWAVYGIAVIAAGIFRQSARIRLAGIALLAAPIVKLFGFDVFLLEQGYRVAAFVILGVLLLGTGLAYQRYSQSVRGFLFGR